MCESTGDSGYPEEDALMIPAAITSVASMIYNLRFVLAFSISFGVTVYSIYIIDDYTWLMAELHLYKTSDTCIYPALNFAANLMIKLFVTNVLFNFLSRMLKSNEKAVHSISTVFGLFLLHSVMEDGFVFYIFIFCLMFAINQLFKVLLRNSYLGNNKATLFAKTGVICLLLYFEFFMSNKNLWTKARGVVMVQAMKFISLTRMFEQNDYPTLLGCLGYVFFPGTVLFGPWIPYATYQSARFNLFPRAVVWIRRLLICAILIPLNLVTSNCVTYSPDHDEHYRWIAAYFKALSFRTSHYFISYLSEFSLIAAGYRDNASRLRRNFSYTVTNPLKMEFPSSLKSVVVNWNLPIHMFLKENVYKSWIRIGKFPAIIITFFVSALLHGLNVPVTMVLLSLGFSCFVEYKLRATLAYHFNICIGSEECKTCRHQYKRSNIIARIINLVFSILTIVQLMYLGAIMDIGTKENVVTYVNYWKSLNFVGHYMAAGMFVLALFSSY